MFLETKPSSSLAQSAAHQSHNQIKVGNLKVVSSNLTRSNSLVVLVNFYFSGMIVILKSGRNEKH